MANIEEKIERLIRPKIEGIGYELYDIEYAKEGKNIFLRIFIDKQEGINLEDCEKVNNEINDIIDKADYIKEQYFLEVSSPGVEKVLKNDNHLKQNIGKEVNVRLFKKDKNGKKEYKGILKKYDDDTITLDEELDIERKYISQIKTIYNW